MTMNFALSEEQNLYREQMRRFGREVIAPRRAEWDGGALPRPIIEAAVAAGLVSREMDFISRGILVEEAGYADFNTALPLLIASEPYELYRLPGLPDEIGIPARQAVAAGQAIIAVGFTEPESGSDMAAFKGRAVREGNQWRLNAVKNSISWVDADYFIITCRSEEGSTGVRGLSNFFIPKETPGVGQARIWPDIGSRGAKRGSVAFDDVRVPADHLIGKEGEGYFMVADFFDTNRAYIALKCLGAAQASVDETCEFVQSRRSMGRPISQYQGISFPLAEAETQLEAARLLCYKTLWMRQTGQRHSREGAMCKWWVPEIAFEIVRKCLTIHGHYGYTQELPFEQRLRDILGWQIGDGTAEISKLLIARAMMGKEAVG
jgi:cyclohexanecarboxyl-CoA dehydrogenase